MTERLTMILPPDVRASWPLVRDRIAQMQVDCDEPWLPEDVFNELVNARAFLWGTEGLEGFGVMQVSPQAYGNDLHVWLCYNATSDGVAAYYEQLLEIARANDCCRITFENDRPGFKRVIPALRMRYLYSVKVD